MTKVAHHSQVREQTERIGVYLTAGEIAAARSAYLTAWQLGGQANTFGRWLGMVLVEHAARTPAKRAAVTRPLGPGHGVQGIARAWEVPESAIEAMRGGIATDLAAGRVSSVSSWTAEAIAAAVKRTRKANGGELVPAPQRLPYRLRRWEPSTPAPTAQEAAAVQLQENREWNALLTLDFPYASSDFADEVHGSPDVQGLGAITSTDDKGRAQIVITVDARSEKQAHKKARRALATWLPHAAVYTLMTTQEYDTP